MIYAMKGFFFFYFISVFILWVVIYAWYLRKIKKMKAEMQKQIENKENA